MSVCTVCGKEYRGNEENFICIHCKAEKGMLEGQELTDYNAMKREMEDTCFKYLNPEEYEKVKNEEICRIL